MIDGRRDDTGWGAGHGWASRSGEPLPQWLEVDFGQERAVHRFVVITYQKDSSAETAGKWGVQDYTIEVWDKGRQKWKPLLNAAANEPVKVRVHQLAKPAHTDKFRIIVNKVAPLDGQARLLQVEAWGTEGEIRSPKSEVRKKAEIRNPNGSRTDALFTALRTCG
jgi:hypothetical protein